MREALRSALSTAVRQDRLTRNVARYGGGVGSAPPPVDRYSTDVLSKLLTAARQEHYGPIIILLARTGLRLGEACGLRWRDVRLGSTPARLTVVWQLDKWGSIVAPKSSSSRRTIPLHDDVVGDLKRWRSRQAVGGPTRRRSRQHPRTRVHDSIRPSDLQEEHQSSLRARQRCRRDRPRNDQDAPVDRRHPARRSGIPSTQGPDLPGTRTHEHDDEALHRRQRRRRRRSAPPGPVASTTLARGWRGPAGFNPIHRDPAETRSDQGKRPSSSFPLQYASRTSSRRGLLMRYS